MVRARLAVALMQKKKPHGLPRGFSKVEFLDVNF